MVKGSDKIFDEKVPRSHVYFLSQSDYYPFESSCIWFGVRIVSNVKFITSEGRQLGDVPFNSYGWCINDGQDGSLKYEGPYEQDLDWSRIHEHLEFVTGNDNRQYITGFKPKNYIGCFEDREQRDLPFQAPENDDNGDRIGYLPETCTQFCRENKYEYAGVQVGWQCFCGNSYGKYGEEPASACDRPCSDDSEPSRCGGSWANSIFMTGFDLSG